VKSNIPMRLKCWLILRRKNSAVCATD
jgi:hypothetical protein